MKINKDIIFSKVNDVDGGMLFDLKNGSYYRVNEVACFIIECIQSGKVNNTGDIAELLCEEYDIDASTALSDTEDVIKDLYQLDLLVNE